jgi:cytochrome c-type biogenesis protein CcmH/NrfG
MVARLAERLKKDGSDVSGWVQLARSYRVLGKADKSKMAIADAHTALAGDQEALQRLDQGLAALQTEIISTASGPGAAPDAANAAAKAANAGDVAPPEHGSGAIEAMVERLAARLKKDGSDVPGWIQLARSYRVLGNADKLKAAIADAHTALASDQEALQRLDQGLAALETDTASSVPAPAATAVNVAPKGPSASDIAAAGAMAPADRNGMIESMVARLAQRMTQNGSDVDGWLRLIKAYSVLGERGKAQAAAANARGALAGNDDNLRRIGELTKELGLEGS